MSMRISSNSAVARTQQTSQTSETNVPEPYNQFTSSIMEASQKYNLPPEVLFGILKQESNGTVDITGSDGHGQGPWQIDDRSHSEFLSTSNNGRDIASSTDYAAKLLRNYTDQLGGDLSAGVSAYNAGVGGVQNALSKGQSPDSATTGGNYSASVMAKAEEFKQYLGNAAGTPGTTPASSSSSSSTDSSATTSSTPASQATSTSGDYQIKSGDTLWGIAGRLKGQGMQSTVTDIIKQIQQANPSITNPNQIKTGDTIKLPGVSTPSGDSFVPSTSSSSGKPELNPSSTAPTTGTTETTATTAVNNNSPVDASKVPFISQFNPDGKDGSYTNGAANCGPTSMAEVARAFGYGQDMTDAQLINQLGSAGGTSEDGTMVSGINAMAQTIGKNCDTQGPGADTDWIADQLKSGKMVVANLDYFATPGHQNESQSSGHYVAVAGMDDSGNFIVRDPADQNVTTLTAEQLSYAISQNPNGGYQFAIG